MDEVLDIIEQNFHEVSEAHNAFPPTATFSRGWTNGVIDGMRDLLEKWVARLLANGVAHRFPAQVNRARKLIAQMKEVKS